VKLVIDVRDTLIPQVCAYLIAVCPVLFSLSYPYKPIPIKAIICFDRRSDSCEVIHGDDVASGRVVKWAPVSRIMSDQKCKKVVERALRDVWADIPDELWAALEAAERETLPDHAASAILRISVYLSRLEDGRQFIVGKNTISLLRMQQKEALLVVAALDRLVSRLRAMGGATTGGAESWIKEPILQIDRA
jgi:hypothetical protein